MGRRWRFLLFSVLLVVVLDQASKWLVNQTIPLGGSIPVLDGLFNLVNIRNRGAAFGFLNRSDIDWQLWFFLAATIVACLIIVQLIRKSGEAPILWLGFGLVMGGALGNLIDRVRLSYVVDFIYFRLIDFPVFNVADIYITCSCAALVLLLIFYYKDDELKLL